jgi:hypothetical protein
MEHKKMRDPEIADERDLVLRRRQQMRRVIRPQNLHRMRIEGDDDRRAARFFCVSGRSGNHSLMAEVNAIENANRKEERAGQSGQVADGTKDVHANDGENDE